MPGEIQNAFPVPRDYPCEARAYEAYHGKQGNRIGAVYKHDCVDCNEQTFLSTMHGR